MAVRTWVWIGVSAVALFLIGLFVLIGAGAYWAIQQVRIDKVTPASAAWEFEQVRARFEGQIPLVEVDGDDWSQPRFHRDELDPDQPRLESLHILVYNPREERLVRLAIPFWLLRLGKHNSEIKIAPDRGDIDFDRLNLTVDDLEREGPGLVLDHQSSDGERVLVWTQ